MLGFSHMKINMHDQVQLDLGLNTPAPVCRSSARTRRNQRRTRAALWFAAMRKIVDTAQDARPSSEPNQITKAA
jgi:hypothetical protein